MATEYNITQKQYNGVDYDTLYPQTTGQQVLLNDDTILYSGIPTVNGALIKQQEDITALNGKLTNYLVVQEHSTTVETSYESGQTGFANITIGKTGYTPLAIATLSGSGTGSFAFQDWYFADPTTVRVYFRNIVSSAATLHTLNVKVLYIKTS